MSRNNRDSGRRSNNPFDMVKSDNRRNERSVRNNRIIDTDEIVTVGELLDPYIEFETQRYFDGTKPDSSWNLAGRNFVRQGATILEQMLESVGIRQKDPYRPPECLNLVLSNEAVIEAERRREMTGGGVDAHPVSVKAIPYDV